MMGAKRSCALPPLPTLSVHLVPMLCILLLAAVSVGGPRLTAFVLSDLTPQVSRRLVLLCVMLTVLPLHCCAAVLRRKQHLFVGEKKMKALAQEGLDEKGKKSAASVGSSEASVDTDFHSYSGDEAPPGPLPSPSGTYMHALTLNVPISASAARLPPLLMTLSGMHHLAAQCCASSTT